VTLTARHHADPSARVGRRPLPGLMLKIGLTDFLVVSWAVLGAQLIRFGPDAAAVRLPEDESSPLQLQYTVFSVLLIGAWMLLLHLKNAHDPRILGHGPEEYKAVFTASSWLFGMVAVVSYVLRLDLARGYVAMALPVGMVGLLTSRWLWRRWLRLHRARGLLSPSVLVVGDRDHLTSLIRALKSAPEAGYHVVAACSDSTDRSQIDQIPLLGHESEAAEVARRIDVDTVACAASSKSGNDGFRRLSWALEGLDVELVVPALTDVAGPRVFTRPVAGLSLLHVEAPVFAGPRLALKNTIDWVGAALLLLLLSPVFAVVAVLIRRDSPGPVFYRQERVGKDGRSFPMFKFRTMQVGAESMLASLLDQSEGKGPLFKLRRDPRITPVGAKLRRYSLDELPQLVNVLRGEMSLVGPRPPLASEVETYEQDVRRRLLVKPGMTGLWQINGRSDLTWDESVRYDLYYVENWSVITDLMILWRTGHACFHGAGAY